jgi:hypothetical protein
MVALNEARSKPGMSRISLLLNLLWISLVVYGWRRVG